MIKNGITLLRDLVTMDYMIANEEQRTMGLDLGIRSGIARKEIGSTHVSRNPKAPMMINLFLNAIWRPWMR